MNDETILTPEGLRKALDNRRVYAHRNYFQKSNVAFYMGRVLGNLFTDETFKQFVELPGIYNKELLLQMFAAFIRPFGSAGQKCIPIEHMDDFLDTAAGFNQQTIRPMERRKTGFNE